MSTLLSFVFTLCVLFSPSQTGVPFGKLDAALDARNADAVVALARDKIVIKYAGKEGIYSKTQAVQIIKEFFVHNPKGYFDFTFKGNETEGGTFAIGNYIEGNSKYRVTVHFKNGSDGYKIECLTIE